MTTKKKGALLIALSAVGFGLSPIFLKMAYAEKADLYQISFSRFFIASVFLWLIVLFRVRTGRIPKMSGTERTNLLRGGAVASLLFSAIVLTLASSLKYLSASASELLYFTYPCWVSLYSVLWMKKRLEPAQIGCLALLMSGTVLTLDFQNLSICLRGLLLALASGVTNAVYIIFCTREAFKKLDSYLFTAVIMTGCMLVFAVMHFIVKPSAASFTPKGARMVVLMALISAVLAMSAYFAGIRHLQSVEVAMVASVEPVVTIVGESFLLRHLSAFHVYMGAALMLLSILGFSGLPFSFVKIKLQTQPRKRVKL